MFSFSKGLIAMDSLHPLPALPSRITRYAALASSVPVDFLADPDGEWEFDSLVEAAGFDPNNPRVCVGALMRPFGGHPEGAAVVTELGRERAFVAIVEYPLEFALGAKAA
jgi:hypothetical protein